MEITVIGFGETGSSIAALLIAQKACEHINVMDPSDQIVGRLLDMKHAAAVNMIQLTHNSKRDFEQADFIFYCAGVRNIKGENRLSVAGENKKLIHTIFKEVKFKKSMPVFIVITNPVELISSWINEFYQGNYTVIGTGTLLDTVRLQLLLMQKFNLSFQQVSAPIIGEHGEGLVALLSKTKLGDQSPNNVLNSTEMEKLLEKVKNMPNQIRASEDASRHGVAQCAIKIFDAFCSDDAVDLIASISLPEEIKNKMGLNSPIFLSLPCRISKSIFKALLPLEISNEEQNALKKSAQKLEAVYLENQSV